MLFGRKKNVAGTSYDKTGKVPVIRASICTGEKTAGFKNIETGKFQEIMLVNSEEAMQEFLETYDISMSEVQREW